MALHKPSSDAAGGRSFSTTAQLIEGFGTDGMGIVYGYVDDSDYYFYTLNVAGKLTFYRIYGDTYPYDQASRMEIIAQDPNTNQTVFSIRLARSPKLSDFPITASPFAGTQPGPRPYKLSIVERGNKIDLYVDDELFHTHELIAKPGTRVGIGVIGTGKYRFLDYAEGRR
jgi:hypothetical protein